MFHPQRWLARTGLDRPEARAWATYDWASSAFSTTVLSAVLPIYFHDVAAAPLEEHLRTAYWGYTTGLGLLISAITAPLLGAVADTLGCKKRFLGWFTVLGAITSALLYLVGRGDWILASILCILANFGFAGANVFYDALLPSVTDKARMDRVSTTGYALGYIGGGLLLAINLAWILYPATFGFGGKDAAVKASFVSVGVWWILFTIPLLRKVPEDPSTYAKSLISSHLVRGSFTRLGQTLRKLPRHRDLLLFLISYWLFTDAIGTIIKMATTYGRELGIGQNHLIGALLLVQFVGIPATFAFGALADRITARAAIQIALAVYTGICVLGFYMESAWQFWLLALLVALVQGGSQALSRSLFATMVPKQQAAEYFSLISVGARFAGILGPLLFGAIAQVAGASRLSILVLVAFFAIGMVLLQMVDVKKAQALAESEDAAAHRHSPAA